MDRLVIRAIRILRVIFSNYFINESNIITDNISIIYFIL